MASKTDMGKTLTVGDEGIWVTFARGMGTKAVREFKALCDEYGEQLYGFAQPRVDSSDVEGRESGDIEQAIRKELSMIKEKEKPTSMQPFTPISTAVECLFFMKTTKPVDPGSFARKICEDARDCPNPMQRKCKYINRLTPVFDTDKATEKGILRVARTVLSPWFTLTDASNAEPSEAAELVTDEPGPAYTYAIRHHVRNHAVFKSEEIIKMVAGLVDPRHKVNLGKPDKVILVEVFQLFCGISVVDSEEWEALKRYNVNALYTMSPEDKVGASEAQATEGTKSADANEE
ncbi:hypothetical protein RJ55_01921 [Drechmeria coniospora]|nr:hypothetical protein RJ55_01921 [Drechmeria coniospora]